MNNHWYWLVFNNFQYNQSLSQVIKMAFAHDIMESMVWLLSYFKKILLLHRNVLHARIMQKLLSAQFILHRPLGSNNPPELVAECRACTAIQFILPHIHSTWHYFQNSFKHFVFSFSFIREKGKQFL